MSLPTAIRSLGDREPGEYWYDLAARVQQDIDGAMEAQLTLVPPKSARPN